ncbi:MAG TPA: NAD(P)-dependent alcohol dehydrogenase [Acidimicrobiia bacterium]|nr:NAD(P)-dependent alcohol dehydrogenase [Acidimicrobiia bacterium]
MKAIVQDRYGGPEVLEMRDVEAPTVAQGEVLLRVRAAGVNPIDWHFMRGEPLVMRFGEGLGTPGRTILGFEAAGTVEAVGSDVTGFAPGDEVWGWCNGGAFAEYVAVRADHLMPKPGHLSFEQLAACPVAALTALQAVRDHGNTQPGHRMLIIGASGGVGTFAVQIAKALGANVTGVCSSRNIDLVKSLGADDVIDYQAEDFARGERRYDVILHVSGNRSFADCRRVLTLEGVLVNVGGGEGTGRLLGPGKRFLAASVINRFVSQRVVAFMGQVNHADGLTLLNLFESEQIRPVIDRTYPLTETAAAIRYLETLRARGKVVITTP